MTGGAEATTPSFGSEIEKAHKRELLSQLTRPRFKPDTSGI
jgi:hypothetical protein